LENKSTLDAFIEATYTRFCVTTFAYTHKKYEDTENPVKLLEQLTDLQHKHDITHCAYGILNEYVEFLNEFHKYGELVYLASENPSTPTGPIDAQEVALKKEIGDIYYYKTMLFNLLDLPHNIADTEWCSEEGLHIEVIGDLIKKHIYYGHDLDTTALLQASFDLDRCFNFICRKFNTTLSEIISQNEVKLRKRYPSGTFTSQEAAAKADTNG
jgi:hypothetical protein